MAVRQRVGRAVFAQFHRPHGLAGHLAGWEMTLRPSNRQRSRWAVGLLEVQPRDRVLEVGFGPGLAIRELARRASDGVVCGIDHSEVMVRQASARNRAAVRQGRVRLRQMSVVALGELPEVFDKVLSVNNFGMWPDRQARLNELACMVRPGGRVALVSQPRCPGATAATTERAGKEMVEQLRNAGFVNVTTQTLALKPPAVCALADAP